MRLLRLVFVAFLAVPLLAESRTPDSTRMWRVDLEHMRREMPRVHRNLFHTVSREAFDGAIDRLAAPVPDRADYEIGVGLARIVASIGDGHTYLNFSQPPVGFRMLPVRFYQFKDGIYIRGAAPEIADLAGARLVTIGRLPAAEAWSATAAITPRDNDSGLRAMTAVQMAVPEVLQALWITPSKDTVTLRVEKNGKQGDVTLEPRPMMEVWRMTMVDARWRSNVSRSVIRELPEHEWIPDVVRRPPLRRLLDEDQLRRFGSGLLDLSRRKHV